MKEEVELELPPNVIDGSARALVSVLGNPIPSFEYTVSHGQTNWIVSITAPYLVLKSGSDAGDILGRALKNLDGLLKMPYGCGEQNMALLAPNIYILQYLKSTEQLTDAILKKANHFLSSGEEPDRDVWNKEELKERWRCCLSSPRVPEAAELQTPRWRFQHIRNRRRQHLVRKTARSQRPDLRANATLFTG